MASPFCILSVRDVKAMVLSVILLRAVSSAAHFSVTFRKKNTQTSTTQYKIGGFSRFWLIC